MKTIKHRAPNGAGFRLALFQSFDETKLVAGRRPILILPGYGMNSFIFSYHPGGTSMERSLVEQGFEVWRVDLREQGESEGVGTGRYSLADLAVTDVGVALSAALAHTRTGQRQIDVIGCSLGGTLMFLHQALVPSNPMASLVTMGSPVRWQAVHPLVRVAFRSATLAGLLPVRGTRRLAGLAVPVLARRTPALLSIYMNPELTDLASIAEMIRTVEDPSRHINRELAAWITSRDLTVRGVNLTESLRRVTSPYLCIAANADGVVPIATATYAFHHVGSSDKKLLVAGDATAALAHADLFVSREAPTRVFAPLAEWLAAHNASEQAGAGALV